jgi:adenylate cyclase
MTESRKLAAIMAVDVVGYSRLMGEDEAGTARAVREHRDAARPIVAGLGGRIVKTMGDGLLLEFPSVVAAVECAVAIQKLMRERNAATPQNKRILYRIGVNLGDVLIEGEDILGDGVNIAARLEGICEPGGILVSGSAFDHVRGKVDANFVDLGEKQLKNIARPVRAFSVDVGGPILPEPATPPKSAAPNKRPMPALWLAGLGVLTIALAMGAWYLFVANRPASNPPAPIASNTAAPAEAAHLSIVVLPFKDLSGDPAQDYFADGITDNLTTDLSRIRGSFVIASTTAFTYKGKTVDAKEIARELGVRYVLEGSVQRDLNRVRVNAQLIDAETGAHLWAERFEEEVADLFKLQDQVVARLANTLGYQLVKAEADKGARSKNPDVVDLTMRGNALFQLQPLTKDNNDAARTSFEQALKIDPNDVAALTGDAVAHLHEKQYGWSRPEADYDAKILGQAQRVIALAPNSELPYYVKSYYLFILRRENEALGTADAGLAINPNSALLYGVRALAQNSLGKFEQAKSDIMSAMRLSPHDPFMLYWPVFLGDAELGLGHFDAAVDAYHRSIDLGNRTFVPYVDLAAAYALQGKMEDAKTALAEARRLYPELTVKWLRSVAPNIPNLFEGVRKAGLPEDAAREPAHLSIVVLPFTNLSGDASQDFFADGITENLTTDLSRIRDSFVIARNTAFTFKGKSIDAKEIGKQLGVRYVLEGSVQRDQNRVRVNAQLVDAESGAHLWADRFEEDVGDLFKLQDQVVARLANSLGYELVKAEAERSPRSNNPDAIELAMRGWAVLWQGMQQRSKSNFNARENINAERTLFEQALEIDPNNADALAGDALSYQAEYQYGLTTTEIDYDAKILGQADHAIALAPENMRAYFVKSVYLSSSHRVEESLGVADAGLAINPNYAPLYAARGNAETSLGRFEQAKFDLQQAIRLSPRDPAIGWWHLGLGDVELGLGHFDAAIDDYHKAIEAGLSNFVPYADLAAAFALEGKVEEAKSSLAEARRLNPKLTVKWLISIAPNLPPLFEGLRKAGLPEE